MTNQQTASIDSVLDLRARVLKVLPEAASVLLNIVDALVVGPRIKTVSEVALSPVFVFELSSLYSAVSRAVHSHHDNKAEYQELKRLLKHLRRAREAWLEVWQRGMAYGDARLGPWRVLVLDATNIPRPKAVTVPRGYVHGSDGMRPGHALSVLSRRVGPGSWMLPLEIDLVGVGEAPGSFGARQIVEYVARQGWDADEVLAIDAGYTNVPTLQPMVGAGANLLGRISGRRVLYLPPPEYKGKGRPAKRGRKVQLWDQRTLPKVSIDEEVTITDGRRFQIARFDDLRMRTWPGQPMTLYRIIEFRADGSRRFKRPLWLIYVGQANAPSPNEAREIYGARFGIEHSFRFLKGELGLIAAQFGGEGALAREQLWVELVATAFWELFALSVVIAPQPADASAQSTPRPPTPGQVRKKAAATFLRIGIAWPSPVSRGKSPGRVEGTQLEPRKRYKVFRKRKRKTAA